MLCGKWFFDSSGGNGHALEHYRDMGYPLAVKLGTITPDGAGECAVPDFASLQWRLLIEPLPSFLGQAQLRFES